MKEKIFIQKAKEHVNLQEFIRKQFAQVKCSNIEVQYTPVVTRIIIHTVTPGLVIGTGGERIRETVEKLKEKFKIENPQIDVQKIENANLDPLIVAQGIVASLENGINYKRLGNFYVEKIIASGAIGCEIIITGKLSGERSRRERFTAGYLKKCGETADRYVMKGFAVANPKLGNIGVTVKIMLERPTAIHMDLLPNPVTKEPETEKEVVTEDTLAEVKEAQPQEEKPAEKKTRKDKEKNTDEVSQV